MKRTRYDGLTVAQTQALGMVAIGMVGWLHPRTRKVLLDRGLIEPREVTMGRDRFGPIVVTTYVMPPAEHIRYCQWCAETVETEA